MRLSRRVVAAAGAAALAVGSGLVVAPTATAQEPGSIADLLGVGSAQLDTDNRRNVASWYDFDILAKAAEVVLAAKPASPVAVLADGDTPLTAFAPNDRAFQTLVFSVSGSWKNNDQQVFDAIAAAFDVDTIEAVLLYHVIPGAAVDSAAVLALYGQPRAARTFTTAQGGTIRIDVLVPSPRFPVVFIADKDRDAVNPFLVKSKLDLRAGEQIAHGIALVLRPIDLPRGY